jgi:hypothetical protein
MLKKISLIIVFILITSCASIEYRGENVKLKGTSLLKNISAEKTAPDGVKINYSSTSEIKWIEDFFSAIGDLIKFITPAGLVRPDEG